MVLRDGGGVRNKKVRLSFLKECLFQKERFYQNELETFLLTSSKFDKPDLPSAKEDRSLFKLRKCIEDNMSSSGVSGGGA